MAGHLEFLERFVDLEARLRCANTLESVDQSVAPLDPLREAGIRILELLERGTEFPVRFVEGGDLARQPSRCFCHCR